ncbi:30S ribosome-binding factor RbfA [Desulfovulcanus sp.]
MRRATSRRAARLADMIMHELARIMVEEIQDPRLQLITISGVRLNRDMSVAEVLYTHIHGQSEDLTQALSKARGFLRSSLGQNLRLRFVPELRFVWDVFLEEMVYDQKS